MDMPVAGESWSLKNNPDRIAVVSHVRIDDPDRLSGYVQIHADWTAKVTSGKSLDTFLKQYEKINKP